MFYGGDKKLYVDNITLLPVETALSGLPALLFGQEQVE
jgi:hypothetical protein